MLTRQDFKADWIQMQEPLFDHLPIPQEIRETEDGALLIFPSIIDGVVLKYVKRPMIELLKEYCGEGAMYELTAPKKLVRVL